MTQRMSYDETLNYTQGKRRAIVELLTTEQAMPKDDKEARLLLTALKDMDSTELTHRRNNIEEEAGNTSREVADSMRALITTMQNANPFQRQSDGTAGLASPGAIPEVDAAKLGEFEIVDGETEIGTIAETSEEFNKRNE